MHAEHSLPASRTCCRCSDQPRLDNVSFLRPAEIAHHNEVAKLRKLHSVVKATRQQVPSLATPLGCSAAIVRACGICTLARPHACVCSGAGAASSWHGLHADELQGTEAVPMQVQGRERCKRVHPHYLLSQVAGCMDASATNYNPDAQVDDGTCEYIISVSTGYAFC